MTLAEFLTRFEAPKTVGSGYQVRCPAHDDKKASLSVSNGGGKILVHCHAGCDAQRIVDKLGLKISDLFTDAKPASPVLPNGVPKYYKNSPVVACYEYRDESGNLRYRVLKSQSKEFPIQRLTDAGQWEWKRPEKKLLYRLDELVNDDTDQPVFIVEGEKDANNLIDKLGCRATSSTGGAGKFDQDNSALKGRVVVILPDNDDPGRNHAADVARKLKGIAQRILKLDLPDLKEHGDASDWIAAGGTKDQLLRMVDDLLKFPDFVPIPDEEFEMGQRVFKVTERGVFHRGKREPVAQITEDMWQKISSCIRHIGGCRSPRGDDWCHLLEITNREGGKRRYLMPLSSRNDERVRQIRAYDAQIYDVDSLQLYLEYRSKRVMEIRRTQGWTTDCSAFIFHDEIIGGSADVYFDSHGETLTKVKGSVEQWRENVGAKCSGNKNLILAVCVAFSAPLLRMLGKEGAIFHFYSDTSTGKSTTLRVGGSVCGGGGHDGYLRTWKSTAAALEIICAEHNDGLLVEDEIGECDAREFEKVAYTLINGQSKDRATDKIKLREVLQWLVNVLSSGNITMEDLLRKQNVRMHGGHRVRNIDIPANTGRYGVFDNLHGEKSPKEFADALSSAARSYYGAPIRHFLRNLTRHAAEQCKAHAKEIVTSWDYADAAPEILRIVEKFALAAAAGEMATRLGITGWKAGEAIESIKTILAYVLADTERIRVGSDVIEAIAAVRGFIERHEQSRFQRIRPRQRAGEFPEEEPVDEQIRDRAGFRDEEFIYFLPGVFRAEVCSGFSVEMVCEELNNRKLIKYIKGRGWMTLVGPRGAQISVYGISKKILEDHGNQSVINA